EGLSLLLFLRRRTERLAGEWAISLLDHRLQVFSRVFVGVAAALGVPVRRSGVLRDTHPQLSSREASTWCMRRSRPPRIWGFRGTTIGGPRGDQSTGPESP